MLGGYDNKYLSYDCYTVNGANYYLPCIGIKSYVVDFGLSCMSERSGVSNKSVIDGRYIHAGIDQKFNPYSSTKIRNLKSRQVSWEASDL